MTAGRSRVDAATVRRRLTLAAEAPTLPYRTSHDTGAMDPATAAARSASEPHADGDGGGADGDGDGTDVADLGVLLEQADEVAARLGDVPAEQIHPDGLAGALGRLRKVRNRLEAVETSWLTQARNRKVHRDQGASSPSKWAAERFGGSQRDASDQIRTADRLVDLPETAGAFGDGHITREAASAIGKAMQDRRLRDMDDAEGRLLAAARDGGADLVRKTARDMRAAADVDAAEADGRHKRARRYGKVWVRDDGTVKVDALLDPDNGEPFYTAFQALFTASFKNTNSKNTTSDDATSDGANPDDGGGPSGRQRGADVLGRMARRLLAADDMPDTAGRAATVLVTIPQAVLHGRADDGPATLRFTGPTPPSTARRHACDASIVPVVLNGQSVPVDIGRASRTPTAAQRRCLAVRDGACCRMCGRADRPLVAHHCTHWADGGPTDLHNLILVCWHCHQLLHEGHWDATWQPDNTVTFTHPDGRRVIRGPPT